MRRIKTDAEDGEQFRYEIPCASPHKNKYWLTRIVFLRYLAFIYLVAFFIAFHQNDSLIGENGLTPAVKFMDRYKEHFQSSKEGFLSHPTIFWFISPTAKNLQYVALTGALISFFIVIMGCANSVMMFILWMSYFSIVNVGQTWYSFGWESQLLEGGFLAIFLVPYFHLQRFPKLTPTPGVVIWGNRWLLFRLMLGAGLIKIRGDECWRDLTCMNYHYQTQPVPNPFSVYFHSSPGKKLLHLSIHFLLIVFFSSSEWFHKSETMINHIVELLCPFLLLIPERRIQFVGGLIQIGFQVNSLLFSFVSTIFNFLVIGFIQFVLILSGNLAFLNWLSILPAIMSIDDGYFQWLFSKEDQELALEAESYYNRYSFVSLCSSFSQSEVFLSVPFC
jgi:hypothetical protein